MDISEGYSWISRENEVKFISYDAGEGRRRDHAMVYDIQDTKYRKEYPLIDWGWEREDCLAAEDHSTSNSFLGP